MVVEVDQMVKNLFLCLVVDFNFQASVYYSDISEGKWYSR